MKKILSSKFDLKEKNIFSENTSFFDKDSFNTRGIFNAEEFVDAETFNIECKHKLNIISLNICSLNAKIDDLRLFIDKLNSKGVLIHVIAIQESWVIKSHQLNFLRLRDYDLFFLSRKKHRGGGIAYFFHNTIQWEIKDDLTILDEFVLEAMCAKITVDKKNFIIGNFYRSCNPKANSSQGLEKFQKTVSQWFEMVRESRFDSSFGTANSLW